MQLNVYKPQRRGANPDKMNANINSILASIRSLFNIDEEATVAEIDQHLIDQLEAQAQTEKPLLEEETEEDEIIAEKAVEEPTIEQEQEQAPDELNSLREMIQQQQQTIAQQQSMIEQLQQEIAALKAQEAAPATSGKKEQTEEAKAPWMTHPLNQKLRRRS
jgi:chromosome segregation ATPase